MPDLARTPCALSIAGSDSGGGAGIQADLKAFARCGVHGMSAITAITAQNTLGVSAIHPVPAETILAQVRAVVGDIGVDAVKVGMLATAEIVDVVARALDELPSETPVVVDPVMVAESGAQLLAPEARDALIAEILPRATVLTPNVPEARALAGSVSAPSALAHRSHIDREREREREEEDAETHELVRAVLALGPRSVVMTGGHRTQTVDLFLDSAAPDRLVSIPGERHPDGAAHGSGCTHSSVLAAQLALGLDSLRAAFVARAIAGEAVAAGLRDVGNGPGPVDVIGLARLRQHSRS
jgi:hydroxymethylpyrimidine/phosphomethylpyrimidine kinase